MGGVLFGDRNFQLASGVVETLCNDLIERIRMSEEEKYDLEFKIRHQCWEVNLFILRGKALIFLHNFRLTN